VVIVAQAVVGMARRLCPDRVRACIAVAALAIMLVAPWSLLQLAAIAMGGVAGWALCGGQSVTAAGNIAVPVSRQVGVACLAGYFVLLMFAFLPVRGGALALFDAFYRAGALVFGGGHVVLPLFLAGYGAAQALPGPLFTFAAYLGAVARVGPGGVFGAAIALVGIFVPGILCLLGTLLFWHELRARPGAQAAMRGANAAVVGLLAAAFYDPVWTSAVHSPTDLAIAAAGFAMLVAWRGL
jgi:chromate transporter